MFELENSSQQSNYPCPPLGNIDQRNYCMDGTRRVASGIAKYSYIKYVAIFRAAVVLYVPGLNRRHVKNMLYAFLRVV